MKIYSLLLLPLVTAGLLHAQNQRAAAPPSAPGAPSKNDASAAIAALQKPYNTAIAGIAAENQKRLAGAENWYLAGLEKAQADYAKAGDLNSALAVKAERERIAAHGETTAEQMKAMPANLRTLRETYDTSLKKIADDVDRRKLQEGQKYQTDLEALQKRITMTGDLDQALLVKAEKERIAAELTAVTHVPAPPSATPVPPIVTTNPPKPAAGTPTTNDPVDVLIGTWRFTYSTGWVGTRTFSKNGTFGGIAKWAIVGKKVVLHYSTADKAVEEMQLPLNPAGIKVSHKDGKVNAKASTVNAVKD